MLFRINLLIKICLTRFVARSEVEIIHLQGGENKGKEKFKSFEKGQDKRKEKSNSQSSTTPSAPKTPKADKPIVPKVSDPARSLCAACGAYSSAKHDPRTDPNSCPWVKDNVEGHNKNWRNTDWLDSAEYKREQANGRVFLGKPSKRKREQPSEKEGKSCNSCALVFNYLSNISLTLPLIDILIPFTSQERNGKRMKLRAENPKESRSQAFLDSGALGGNFASLKFAEELKNKGYIIEKLDSSCSIGTPDGDHRLKSHSLINFEIMFTDEFGIENKIDIRAHILDIK